MRMRTRRNRNVPVPTLIMGAILLGWIGRAVVPDLVRYVRIKRM
jgi:hypothetical protein